MSNNQIRVRFAPSPTGPLHVGGARTALFNWLFARKSRGKFILRIEDTDRDRYDEESEAGLMRDLKFLGLNWDEGPDIGGDRGPYKQSLNLEEYQRQAEGLVEHAKAYRCFCTAERLAEVREKQKKEKSSVTGYDRHCRNLSRSEVQTQLDDKKSFVIRLKVPLEGVTEFTDLLRGPISYRNELLDDLILFKSNGFPSYHLASLVDDHNMGISHVLRGEEWIPSTPKHVLIHQALGFTPPVYVHLPVILAEGGKKLAKRKGAASVTDYQNRGYLPDALNNFLALLGWNPGDDLELMDRKMLIENFSLEKISPKSCFFDEKKLEWMNGHYIQSADPGDLASDFNALYQEKNLSTGSFSNEYIVKVITLLQERCKVFTDFYDLGLYFFQDPSSYDPKAAKKRFKPDTPEFLKQIIDRITNMDNFDAPSLEGAYTGLAAELGFESSGKLIHPTRLVLSGISSGPGLFELMELLGREVVLRRLDAGLKYLQSDKS